MNTMTREEMRAYVDRMERAHIEVARIRREALRGMPYDWQDVDALLALGDVGDYAPRTTSGLVEMQRLFRGALPR